MAGPHPSRHTRPVPRSWLAATLAALALVASATAARAQPPPDPDADDQGEFWGAFLAPHSLEVASLLENGRLQVNLAHQAALGRAEPRFRAQRLREASSIAGRIRALDPRAPVLDYLLGLIADESGRGATAARQLASFAAQAELGPLRTDALLRLGRIALTRAAPADAILPLRTALAEQRYRGERAQALILLADALDGIDQLDGAIALLAGALDRSQGPGELEDNAVWMALVAAYDRDEQVSASLELVERLKSALGSDYVVRLTAALDDFTPAPLAAVWYQRALIAETGDQLDDARAAWTTYLGLPSARYRPRAQAHVDAIDVTLAARRAPVKPFRPARRPRGVTP